MSYDSNLPQALKETQKWFAAVITQPMNDHSEINPIAPNGQPIKEEAKKFITPNQFLEPWERIELYNQQYWWRMLSHLHDMAPFVTRLFGFRDFNHKIGIPYLVKYPHNDWSLNKLICRLPNWIEEEYKGDDKKLIYHAAVLDQTFNDGFFYAEKKPLSLENLPNPAETPLFLQEHITLFEFPYQLFKFRQEMLKEKPDYWLDHDFPEMEHGEYNFITFRNPQKNMIWKQIKKEEYTLLSAFKKGKTIEEACSYLKDVPPELGSWFQDWAKMGWLTLEST